MSNLPDLSEVIRHCDTAFLDEHFAWNADPVDIADQLHAEIRAEVLNEAAEVAESTVALFEDSEEGAAAAGAMEGLAIRFRRMAAGKAEREGGAA